MADYNLNSEAGKIKTESGAALNTAGRIGEWMEQAVNEINRKPTFTLDDGFVPAANLNGNLIGKKPTFTSLSDFITSLDTAANYFSAAGFKQWEIIASGASYKLFTDKSRSGHDTQIIIGCFTLTDAGAISQTLFASKPNIIMRYGLSNSWSKWEYQIKGDNNIYAALSTKLSSDNIATTNDQSGANLVPGLPLFNAHVNSNAVHTIPITITAASQLDGLLSDGKIYNVTETIGSPVVNYILITGNYAASAIPIPSIYQLRYRKGILEQRTKSNYIGDEGWTAWESMPTISDLATKADITKSSGETAVYGLITSPSAGDTLVYDGSKWVNKSFDLSNMEQQCLMGNFMVPFFPRGDNSATARMLVDITTPVRVTVVGDAHFYTNNEGTEGETKELTVDTSYTSIYLKAKAKCYVVFHGGLNNLTRFEITGSNSPNSPNPIVDSSFVPDSLIMLTLAGCFGITGIIRLGDLPQSIRQLNLYHFYNWGGVSKITGNLQDLKASQFNTFSVGEVSDCSISGDLKVLTDKHPRLISLTTLGSLVFSDTSTPTDYEVSDVYLNTPVDWQSADTDRILNYYASANWIGNKTLNLAHQKPHTSASDAAIATLVGKGVTVTVN